MKIVAAMMETIMTAIVMEVIMAAIRMIEIVVAAVVVSTMWQSMILWMTTSITHTTTTINMLIPEAIDWEIVEH